MINKGIHYAFLLVLGTVLFAVCAVDNKRLALWHIVHDQCLENQVKKGTPSPCEYADEEKGYAVLKDRNGIAQYLLISTNRVSGIESPEIILKDAVNYWQAAWQARKFVFRKLGRELRRDEIGMAINSSLGRSQDQLHIHIDCLKPDVTQSLRGYEAKLSANGSKLPFEFNGHHYKAMRIDSEDLQDVNPFRLLAAEGGDMKRETLAVAGATFSDGRKGFIMLSDTADLAHGDRASGEELQDHGCKIVTPTTPTSVKNSSDYCCA